MKTHELRLGFKEPPRKYAIYPIIHGGVVDQTKVDGFEEAGFAGVVGNIPYTCNFTENPKEWKEMEQGMRAYIDKGMHAWIYDEKGYPSGTAGGYITETFPEYIAKGLYCYHFWPVIKGPRTYRTDIPEGKLWRAFLLPMDEGEPIDVTDSLNEKGVLYIEVPVGEYQLLTLSIRRLFEGTHAAESHSEPRNYVSLSDEEATKAFLRVTHEKYKEYLADEFGKGVVAMFTDEPSLISWYITRGTCPVLSWHEKYPEQFYQLYGYDFALACIATFTRRGRQAVKRRCDYWEYMANAVADSYFKIIKDWCHANNLKSSGHFFEEERLQAHVVNYGSFYRCMKQLDWPGIDMLESRAKELMSEDKIPIARLAASFADISGEHEVFTEFSGHTLVASGLQATLNDYYASIHWHLALGVNNFTSYYNWKGITKEQKIAMNQYVARCGYMLRQGNRDSRVAIFYPEAAMWESYIPSVAWRGIDTSDPTKLLDMTFTKVSWELLHCQLDYDYIDCELLINGEIRNGKLCYRDREYSAIVIPCARVLEDAAARKLLDLAGAGVAVLFAAEVPSLSRETGEASPYAELLRNKVNKQENMYFETELETFGSWLRECIPACCHTVYLDSYQPMLLSHGRMLEDNTKIIFLANMGEDTYIGKCRLEGVYKTVLKCDINTGDMIEVDFETDSNFVTVDVEIPSGEARLFLLCE